MFAFLLRKLWRDFQGEVLALPTRTILFAAAVVLLLPLMTADTYLLRIIAMAAIFAIYAASWDMLVGFAGQVSLGHSLFFGVSAYTTALLNLRLGLPPLLSIPFGALAAVLAGLLLSMPALRLRGPYFSLASLAMPIILLGVIFTFPGLTGGELGLSGISRLGATRRDEYYVIMLAMFALTLLMWKIVKIAGEHWLRTGDLGRMDEEGYFHYVDRKRDLIKFKGYSVFARDVEDVLYQHPQVKAAGVIGVPDERAGQLIKANVVLQPEARGKLSEEEIIRFCSERLAFYKVPKIIVEFRGELPKTDVGKVSRRELREEEDA